ncbi:MAG: hypothetical protein WAL35_07695, partial [Acidimicrobiales bacterium]
RGPIGADVVIEASGRLEAAAASFGLVRRGGTVLLFGVYPRNRSLAVNAFQINEDELRVVGSFNNPSTHSRALELISSGRVKVDGVVSDRLPLDDLAIAMDLSKFAAPRKIAIELRVG